MYCFACWMWMASRSSCNLQIFVGENDNACSTNSSSSLISLSVTCLYTMTIDSNPHFCQRKSSVMGPTIDWLTPLVATATSFSKLTLFLTTFNCKLPANENLRNPHGLSCNGAFLHDIGIFSVVIFRAPCI